MRKNGPFVTTIVSLFATVQKSMNNQEAIRQIIINKGTQFDPEVVNAFLKVVDKYHI